jgi:putative tricarboxylic transport membrane protein
MPRDLVSGLFWLAVALFAAAQGLSLKLGSLQRPGPGFFPFWGGVVLGLLSIVLVIRALRESGAADRVRIRLESSRPVVVVAAVLGYLLLLETLGFVAVTLLLLLLLFRLEGRAWAFSAVSAVVGALASYTLFQLWLKTQLPTGPLGF